jgi:alpha-galactosidase
MLLRVHQSGHLADLPADRLRLVREGIETYKRIRADIPRGRPAWPAGLPSMASPWTAFALLADDVAYLAVWRFGGVEESRWFTLPDLAEGRSEAEALYPSDDAGCAWAWDEHLGRLSVMLPRRFTARVFRIWRRGLR